MYLAYARSLSPAAGATSCTPSVDCLVLHGTMPADDKPAVVVSAGPALADQDRGVWSPTDYYEEDNATASDDRFTAARVTERFNDQIRVIPIDES